MACSAGASVVEEESSVFGRLTNSFLAALFPNARITGTDLSPIQPSLVPPKVNFEIHDCTETDWCRSLASLDFIHAAIMLGSLPSYSKLIRNARRYLKPGSGWLECHEMMFEVCCDDGTVPQNWPFQAWQKYFHEGSTKMDEPRQLHVAHQLATWMREAGYLLRRFQAAARQKQRG